MDIDINSNNQQPVEQSFFFEAMPQKLLENKQFKEVLTKWGLAQSLKIATFRFNQHFQQYDTQRFLKDLFTNPNVRYQLNSPKFPLESLGSVQFQKLKCDQLSLELFDEFQKQGIVKSDYIQKCMSEYFQGIEVCDKIRECLLLQESQSYCLFSEQKRKQLLFKIFQLLLIGGSLNQYEDKLTPYLQWTKTLYKSIVSVRKRSQTGQIFVQSLAYRIKSFNEGKIKLQDYNPQNLMYVVINPSLRTAHIIMNEWIKFW